MSIVGVGLVVDDFTTEPVISLELPLYWSNTNAKPTQLPLLEGTSRGTATSINSSGQIVGYANNSIPIIWSTPNTKPKRLPLLDGTLAGVGNGINNLGQIVGVCFNADFFYIPVIWANPNEKPIPLQLVDKTTSVYATGINNLGQIVGYSISSDLLFKTAVIWSDSNAKPTKLPFSNSRSFETLLGAGNVIGINDSSQISSYSDDDDRDSISVPFLLPSVNATPVKLPLLPGKSRGYAFGINNLGQIVGVLGTYIKTGTVSVIWASANATPTVLQTSDTFNVTIALGISGPSTPTPSPISNICFPAGTPVQTDQGTVNIDAIDPQKHTIASQSILHITKTTTLDNYLICFDKHSLGRNVPSTKTIMTKDHKIMFEGRMVPAYRLLDYSDKVKKVKYNGETLYNILLAEHGTIHVNNMVCETLHPENIIAKLYMRKADEQPRLVYQLNNSLENKDILSYKDVVNRLTYNL